MNPQEVRSKLETAAARFVDEVTGVLAEAFASVAQDLAAASSSARAKSQTIVVRSKAPRAQATSEKRNATDRSPRGHQPVGTTDSVESRLVALLEENGTGLRAEQLNRLLGTSTKQLALPIAKLLAEGKLRKEGVARGTKYFCA